MPISGRRICLPYRDSSDALNIAAIYDDEAITYRAYTTALVVPMEAFAEKRSSIGSSSMRCTSRSG